MLVVASVVSGAATEAGLMTACIAVGGFLAHAPKALQGKGDPALRVATVVGGLIGLGAAGLVNVAAILLA
jgi:hypothetical protein